MLRLLLALLLVANGLYFAWAQGWLAPGLPAPREGEREPERIAAQLRPEAVVVLPPKAASAAVTAARAAAAQCLEAGPFPDAAVAAAEVALMPAQLPAGSWQREAATLPLQWLLYIGRLADPARLRAVGDELRKLNLSFEVLDAPPELAPGLVLSRHASRAEAEAALAMAANAALKGLRVVSFPAPLPQFWLRVPRADGDQQDRLRALPSEALAGGFKPCAARS